MSDITKLTVLDAIHSLHVAEQAIFDAIHVFERETDFGVHGINLEIVKAIDASSQVVNVKLDVRFP